jgi:hypothetical protein
MLAIRGIGEQYFKTLQYVFWGGHDNNVCDYVIILSIVTKRGKTEEVMVRRNNRQGNEAIPATRNRTQRPVQAEPSRRPRNQLDFNGDDVEWEPGITIRSMVRTHRGNCGVIIRSTTCSVDVRWAGQVISNKPKSSVLIVDDEIETNRNTATANATNPRIEIFATEAFPVMAHLMVRSVILSGMTSTGFDNCLESLRYQFENANLNGEANHVERGVREREDNIVCDSDGDR